MRAKTTFLILMVVLVVLLPVIALAAPQAENGPLPLPDEQLSFERIRAVLDFAGRAIRLALQISSIAFEAIAKILKLILDFIPTLPKSGPQQGTHNSLLNFTLPPLPAPSEGGMMSQ